MDISQIPTPFFAAFGFILYESLRVYRERWWEKVKTDFNIKIYIFCIVTLCLGITLLATLISEGSRISAVALGFTFPVSAEKYFSLPSSNNLPNQNYQKDDTYKEVEETVKDVRVEQINIQEISLIELWKLRYLYIITGNNPLKNTPPDFY